MANALRHRGPDDGDTWMDASHGVALGHRRLAIVDRSAQGHQPMASACGRYMLVYNGEIYNHAELREQLGAWPWRGGSDTETMLACFSRYGIVATLERLVGMFAFAVWDRQERRLVLARDRLGEKPLYWGHLPNGDLVFASELKALRVHPEWRGEIDRDAVALYMRHNAIPAPLSVYRGIGKLRPAEWLTARGDGAVEVRTYWNLADVARGARASPTGLDDETAIDALDEVLGRAVRGQMKADVPLGAFLSGGVDSSLVVAMMCRHTGRAPRTFAIGFQEADFDESSHARAVAAHFGTRHVEMVVTGADALAVIPHLPRVYDEPFADASQIPTLLVSWLAREHVTVALCGDGGDELFAGYDRYLVAHRLWPRLQRLPLAVRRAAARSILQVRPSTWASIARAFPSGRARTNVGGKVHKFAQGLLAAASRDDMHSALMSQWREDPTIVLGAQAAAPLGDARRDGLSHLSDVEFMSLLDQLAYLPDDILVKVDRAAMSVGLETRAPLLDHRVVEFAWQTPMHQKIRHGTGKWLARQLLHRHVPLHLVDRPKQGFFVPLDDWLRGPLRTWAADLLAPEALRRQGLFDADAVARRWKQHLDGTRNWQYELWAVLMFQAWWLETTAAVPRDGHAIATPARLTVTI